MFCWDVLEPCWRPCSPSEGMLPDTLVNVREDSKDMDLQDRSSALLIFPPLRVDRPLLSLPDLLSERLLGVAPGPGTWLRPGMHSNRSWQPFTHTSSRPDGDSFSLSPARHQGRKNEWKEGRKDRSKGDTNCLGPLTVLVNILLSIDK